MANSKTRNNQPVEKISASPLMSERENSATAEHAASAPPDVITRFQRFQAVLTDTGLSIPRLLSERLSLRTQVGRVEVERGDASELQQLRERLDTVGNALASAARQRSAASESLLSLSGEIREARRAAEAAMAGISQAVISDFQMRWAHAVGELSRLHGEASALSRILRRSVPSPPPYCATVSVDGGRNVVAFCGLVVEDVALPPEVSAITARLDAFDSALAACAAVAQGEELTRRYYALARVRQEIQSATGLFRVIKPFASLGSEFPMGVLIDASVLPMGLIHRFWLGRHLMPLESSAVVAA
jgi:hypothetical protein